MSDQRPPVPVLGVERTLATAACPACGEVFYGRSHKTATSSYVEHWTATHKDAAPAVVLCRYCGAPSPDEAEICEGCFDEGKHLT